MKRPSGSPSATPTPIPRTGLGNRRELMRALDEALDSRAGGVFLVLDLDHFKRLNDLHGHLAGDKVLLRVGRSLKKSGADERLLRATGGDEFAVLLPGADDETAEDVAAKILGRRWRRRCSSRARRSRSPRRSALPALAAASDEETALRQSDVALYAAKRAGRNSFAWFDEELEREITERLKLEEDIRARHQGGRVHAVLPAAGRSRSRQIIGFEALARWRSPTRGLLEAEASSRPPSAPGSSVR